ncbi:MAG: hypothetical protein ACKPJJ_15410, partial [Planctomycetaceae bacterium]
MPMRENPEVSYTQQEFRHARRRGIPVLVFLLGDDAEIPVKYSKDLEYGQQQQAFRAEVQNFGGVGLTCQFFVTADELQRLVYVALQRVLETKLRRVVRQGAGRDVECWERVLHSLAFARVAEWEQACRGDRQDRLEHYVPPHYSLLREGLQPVRLKAG